MVLDKAVSRSLRALNRGSLPSVCCPLLSGSLGVGAALLRPCSSGRLGPDPATTTTMGSTSPCQASNSISSEYAVGSRVRNRNPVNLEKMTIGYKPKGFPMERRKRNYWNCLDLSITAQHTTATVTHWTGRRVCSASTKEWAIRKFLYNYTDSAALKVVGQVVGQRCLETGLAEVFLQITGEDMIKERMRVFVEAIKGTGLILEEPDQYEPFNPNAGLRFSEGKIRVQPWTVTDE